MLLHTILQLLHAIQSFGLQLLLPQKLQPEDLLSCQVEEEEKYTNKQQNTNVTSVLLLQARFSTVTQLCCEK